MPASSGRVRMPHKNRMTTSNTLKTSDIWSKTIGHDPYANQGEQGNATAAAAAAAPDAAETAKKVKNVMQLARSQNVTDGSNRDGFTAKLYLGLKQGKVRKSGDEAANSAPGGVDPKLRQMLEDPDSSSEEEFVEVSESRIDRKTSKEEKKEKSSKKIKKRRRRRHASDDESSSSSDGEYDDSSVEKQRRKRRRREKRKRSKPSKHSKRSSRDEDVACSSSDSEAEERQRVRKHKHRRDHKSSRMDRRVDNGSHSD